MLLTTPNGTVTIRPAQQTDAPAFRELRLEALRHHPEAFRSDYQLNEAKPLTAWTDRVRLRQPEGSELIAFATHTEQLIGMSGITPGNSPKTQHSAYIWGVYVQPEWRGWHLAEGLITVCLEWAQLQGVRVVKLGVVTSNTAAIRCYTRLGFRAYGVEPQALYHQSTFYDELLMSRSL